MKSTSLHSKLHLRLLFLALASILFLVGYRSCSDNPVSRIYTGKYLPANPGSPREGSGPGAGIATMAIKKAPDHVRRVIDHLKTARGWQPLRGYKGGKRFRNREGILPRGKTYYEFDVHPLRPGVSRGAERVVVDQEKSVFYYTKDHYNSFFKIQ